MGQIIVLHSVITPLPENVQTMPPAESVYMSVADAAALLLKEAANRPYQKFALVLDDEFDKSALVAIYAQAPVTFHATDPDTLAALWRLVSRKISSERVIMSLDHNLGMIDRKGTDMLTLLLEMWIYKDIDTIPDEIRCHSCAPALKKELLRRAKELRHRIGSLIRQ